MANYHTDQWIMAQVERHYREALMRYPEHRIIGVFLQGSQNYGLDYEGSDIDTKCILAPSWEDLCFNRKAVSTTHVLDNEEHLDAKDIRLYMQCFRKQNLNFVEILFTPYKIINPLYREFWNELIENNEQIAHYDMRWLKPIDESILAEVVEKYHTIITVEDGVISGGLGSAVAEFILDHSKFKTPNSKLPHLIRLGVNDQFVEHGSTKELYHLLKLDKEGICESLLQALEQ